MANDARLTFVVAEGAWGTVESAVLASGEAPAIAFLTGDLEQLFEGSKDEEDGSATARFLVLFQQMANYGHVSPKRLKSEMKGLHAFRHEVRNKQIRFPCFRDGDRWILTHGFFKPTNKNTWPRQEITRANKIRDEYLRRKNSLGAKATRDKQ